jgi:hypothetical protein
MRINSVRSPILAFAVLTAVFVPIMTSQGLVSAIGAPAGSASPSAPDPSGSASAPASPSAGQPPARHHRHRHKPKPAPSRISASSGTAAAGAFYRSVLDLRPELPGITDQQYYDIGQAFCTQDDLSLDALNQVQAAYAMPAGSLDYDNSMATMMLETAPMEFIQENQDAFGFDGSNIDGPTLNAFRLKLCSDHALWSQYAQFVHEQLATLGPWQTDPSFAQDPGQSSSLWGQDLATWESALQPWLPNGSLPNPDASSS